MFSLRQSTLVKYLANRFSWFRAGAVPFRDDRSANLFVSLRKRSSKPFRLGFVGPSSKSGLGYQGRDLVDKLGIRDWLAISNKESEPLDSTGTAFLTRATVDTDQEVIREWLRKIDCLLFCETPVRSDLPGLAHSMGIPSVCIVNWEWLGARLPWLKDVDLLLAPNHHTYDLLNHWKCESLPRIEIELIPGLVDVDRFVFKEREVCRSFLFVNGQGGYSPIIRGALRDKQGPPRKGLSVVLEAARLAPEIPIKIRSQVPIENDLPPNVELLPSQENNAKLYEIGDVAVQPSLMEGTGLQMIEMMAAGLPLITTDAPPMNEFPALNMIECHSKLGKTGRHIIDVSFPSAAHLAQLMRMRFGTDISGDSRAARSYVLENHSWNALGDRFKALFNSNIVN